MRWQVYGYVHTHARNQNGKGARNIIREFDDEASAHRFALHIVESGPATCASVKRIDDNAEHA